MSPTKKVSPAFGLLFLATSATSIAALAQFQPVLDDPTGSEDHAAAV